MVTTAIRPTTAPISFRSRKRSDLNDASQRAPGALMTSPPKTMTSSAIILDDPVPCCGQPPRPLAIDTSARFDVVWKDRTSVQSRPSVDRRSQLDNSVNSLAGFHGRPSPPFLSSDNSMRRHSRASSPGRPMKRRGRPRCYVVGLPEAGCHLFSTAAATYAHVRLKRRHTVVNATPTLTDVFSAGDRGTCPPRFQAEGDSHATPPPTFWHTMMQ